MDTPGLLAREQSHTYRHTLKYTRANSHNSQNCSLRVCQVMDTPGLLARDGSEHNAMELLTLAAIEHTSAIVVFVFDPSGT